VTPQRKEKRRKNQGYSSRESLGVSAVQSVMFFPSIVAPTLTVEMVVRDEETVTE
jgi:hypothetical protein